MPAFSYNVPVLDGQTLPDPSEISVKADLIGGSEDMADGRIIHDLVNPDVKHTFTYRWSVVFSISEILAGWAAMKSDPVSLVHIDGQTYSVTRPTSGKSLTYNLIKASAGIVWEDVQLIMREY